MAPIFSPKFNRCSAPISQQFLSLVEEIENKFLNSQFYMQLIFFLNRQDNVSVVILKIQYKSNMLAEC